MDNIQKMIAEFAQKLVAEVKASGLPHVNAATAFGVAAKILAAEESVNVPLGDCEGWARKRLNDGFACEVTITPDATHSIITPVAPKFDFIAE